MEDKNLPLEINVVLTLRDDGRQEIEDIDYHCMPLRGRLFASGADNISFGEALYKKISDVAKCREGTPFPQRHLTYKRGL